MNKDTEPIRIDEMGIEVCVLCDCAVENNTCLCDMKGWDKYNCPSCGVYDEVTREV